MDPRQQIEEIVDKVLTKVRLIWLAHALVATALLWFLLSGWWLLLIPVYLSGTYQAALHVAASSLERTIPAALLQADRHAEAMRALDEIERRVKSNEVTLEEDLYALIDQAGLGVGVVHDLSEKVVGRYLDQDIHEWLEFYDPTSKKVERFFFEQVAPPTKDIPVFKGKVSASVNGLIYTRPLQPEES